MFDINGTVQHSDDKLNSYNSIGSNIILWYSVWKK